MSIIRAALERVALAPVALMGMLWFGMTVTAEVISPHNIVEIADLINIAEPEGAFAQGQQGETFGVIESGQSHSLRDDHHNDVQAGTITDDSQLPSWMMDKPGSIVVMPSNNANIPSWARGNRRTRF
jgi:hypothetical protein